MIRLHRSSEPLLFAYCIIRSFFSTLCIKFGELHLKIQKTEGRISRRQVSDISSLDKILSNWVFWAIFTHPFLIKLGIRILFGYPVLLIGARNIGFWVVTP